MASISVDVVNSVPWNTNAGDIGHIFHINGVGEAAWGDPPSLSIAPALESIGSLATTGGEFIYTTASDSYATSSISADGYL